MIKYSELVDSDRLIPKSRKSVGHLANGYKCTFFAGVAQMVEQLIRKHCKNKRSCSWCQIHHRCHVCGKYHILEESMFFRNQSKKVVDSTDNMWYAQKAVKYRTDFTPHSGGLVK